MTEKNKKRKKKSFKERDLIVNEAWKSRTKEKNQKKNEKQLRRAGKEVKSNFDRNRAAENRRKSDKRLVQFILVVSNLRVHFQRFSLTQEMRWEKSRRRCDNVETSRGTEW